MEEAKVLPADAGMIPLINKYDGMRKRAPRGCGDDPECPVSSSA